MALKIYEYNRCGTCRNALKFLNAKDVKFEAVPIRETPPTMDELKFVLEKTGEIKKLLNTSGQDYRALNMKDKVKELSNDEILKMLTENGNLIKRPFVIDKEAELATTGFKADIWEEIFN
ncbi:MAG: Spx/MgsR family RNA polymerase-binding regulatory protein [Lentisphaeraceae bacterium]|nr:Spx/MgsR family RNA polymerase-binding regulatory protein [Lentisphaeraceae bacterium]